MNQLRVTCIGTVTQSDITRRSATFDATRMTRDTPPVAITNQDNFYLYSPYSVRNGFEDISLGNAVLVSLTTSANSTSFRGTYIANREHIVFFRFDPSNSNTGTVFRTSLGSSDTFLDLVWDASTATMEFNKGTGTITQTGSTTFQVTNRSQYVIFEIHVHRNSSTSNELSLVIPSDNLSTKTTLTYTSDAPPFYEFEIFGVQRLFVEDLMAIINPVNRRQNYRFKPAWFGILYCEYSTVPECTDNPPIRIQTTHTCSSRNWYKY